MNLKIIATALVLTITCIAPVLAETQNAPAAVTKEPIKIGRLFSTSALPLYIEPAVNASFFLAALKQAGSDDPIKISKAAEGLTIPSPMGEVTMRAIDHRSTAGYFLGQLQPDGSWKFFERIDVNKGSPSDAWINEQRK